MLGIACGPPAQLNGAVAMQIAAKALPAALAAMVVVMLLAAEAIAVVDIIGGTNIVRIITLGYIVDVVAVSVACLLETA